MIFQRPDLLPHGSRGYRELVCCACERQMPCSRVIDAQGIQRQVSPLHSVGDLGWSKQDRKHRLAFGGFRRRKREERNAYFERRSILAMEDIKALH